jgi:hypothetical protein
MCSSVASVGSRQILLMGTHKLARSVNVSVFCFVVSCDAAQIYIRLAEIGFFHIVVKCNFVCVCGWSFYIVDDYRRLGYETILFDNFCRGFRELHFYIFEVSLRTCFYIVTYLSGSLKTEVLRLKTLAQY